MKPTTDIDQLAESINYGKVLPQAIEVEEAVLGALVIEERAILEHKISTAWFYKEEHRIIVDEIIRLSKAGIKIDLVTVVRALKDSNKIDEIGGFQYIVGLTRQVASAAHMGHHLKILQDKFTRREVIRISAEFNRIAYDESRDVDDIIAQLHNNTLGIMDYHEDKIHSFKDALNLLVKKIAENEKEQSLTGIPTGFRVLNNHTGGWQPTDLVIIAGESSQGKSSLAMKFTLEAGLGGVPGAMYSLEMSTMQLTARVVSMYTKINSKRILVDRLNSIEMQAIGDSVMRLSEIPVYIDDDVNNNLDSILLSIRRLHLKFGIRFAVVDYIQNISEIKGKNEEGSLGIIAKSLKNLAKELNITIFVVSQLSRNKERPFPTISRLRGSGQLEETADIVITVFRPEYYQIKYPEPYENVPVEGTGMISILKGRNIGTGNFFAKFDAKNTNWSDNNEEEADVF